MKQFGGNSSSEAAVASGLEVAGESSIARWELSFNHHECKDCDGKCSSPGDMKECRIAATGLALLRTSAAGIPTKRGITRSRFATVPMRLVKMGKITPDGFDLRGELAANHAHAAFYSQGIATIALSENRGPFERCQVPSASNEMR